MHLVSHCSFAASLIACFTVLSFVQVGKVAAENTVAGKSTTVTLGEGDLLTGIPGEGPLTDEQIKQWLDDEQNHIPLKIKLPMGLSLGKANITGVKENPMTRAKIELGRQLYFDKRLSSNGEVSCADCHHPDEGYGRQTQFGVGVDAQEGNRNSPISYNRILSGPQFWDGRAASLEEQAIGPIANPIEMGNTHEACIISLKEIPGYKMQFAKVIGDRDFTIEDIGVAIAAFERAIVTGPSAYDYAEPLRTFTMQYKKDLEDLKSLEEEDPDLFDEYQEVLEIAKTKPMSESAARGRDLFFSERVGCTACHVGANFTDEKYHNLGVGMDATEPDLGRFVVTNDEKDKGAFKTPTVRNITASGPYMHDGSQQTLEEVVEWYAKGGHANAWLSDKIKKIDLNDQEKKDLVEFMKSLTGDFPKVEMERLPE